MKYDGHSPSLLIVAISEYGSVDSYPGGEGDAQACCFSSFFHSLQERLFSRLFFWLVECVSSRVPASLLGEMPLLLIAVIQHVG